MLLFAKAIDVLEIALPAAAVLGVVIFFLVTKFGRDVISDSHDKGRQAGEECGKKLVERFKKKKP